MFKVGLKTKITKKIFCILFIFLTTASCFRDKYDNEVLYNSVGFDPGSNPAQNRMNNNVPNDYYYRQAQSAMGPGQIQNPNYPPPAQYYPPQYSSPPYQVYPNAGSRFYSNPYAIPPSPYYPQYDVDQYYVPPTYSYGVEQSGSSRKSAMSR